MATRQGNEDGKGGS